MLVNSVLLFWFDMTSECSHKVRSGSEKMAQWVQCLLHRREELSSDPQDACKKQSAVVYTCNPRARRQSQSSRELVG